MVFILVLTKRVLGEPYYFDTVLKKSKSEDVMYMIYKTDVPDDGVKFYRDAFQWRKVFSFSDDKSFDKAFRDMKADHEWYKTCVTQ
jgi:hypothetical protein